VTLYHRIKSDPNVDIQPRTFIFGGKAAPGYHFAKLMIKLITAVGELINKGPGAARSPEGGVPAPTTTSPTARRVYPGGGTVGADLNPPGKEASGTGNMKFSMNGGRSPSARLDGANVEIREEVGAEKLLSVRLDRRAGPGPPGRTAYDARAIYRGNDEAAGGDRPRRRRALLARRTAICSARLVDSLLNGDAYRLLADFPSYVDCQGQVERWPTATRRRWDPHVGPERRAPHGQVFPRTGASANTASRSGGWNR